MQKYYENKRTTTNLTSNRSTSTEILTSTSFDNVWDSFQEDYEYLMDEGLIDSCKLDKKQLNSSKNTTDNVSFTEFVYQLNQLNKWLDSLRSLSYSNTRTTTTTSSTSTNSCCEKYANQVSMTCFIVIQTK